MIKTYPIETLNNRLEYYEDRITFNIDWWYGYLDLCTGSDNFIGTFETFNIEREKRYITKDYILSDKDVGKDLIVDTETAITVYLHHSYFSTPSVLNMVQLSNHEVLFEPLLSGSTSALSTKVASKQPGKIKTQGKGSLITFTVSPAAGAIYVGGNLDYD